MKIKIGVIMACVFGSVLVLVGCSDDANRAEIKEDLAQVDLSLEALEAAQKGLYEKAQTAFEFIAKTDDDLFLHRATRTMAVNAVLARVQQLLDSTHYERAYAETQSILRSGRADVILRKIDAQLAELNRLAEFIEEVKRIQNVEMSDLCLTRLKEEISRNSRYKSELLTLYRVCLYNQRYIAQVEKAKSNLLLWLDYEDELLRPSDCREILFAELEIHAPYLHLRKRYSTPHRPLLSNTQIGK